MITAVVCTKNRYDSTLPLCLEAIINQTYPIRSIVIFDDNEKPQDLRDNNLYRYIFKKIEKKNIKWEVIFGENKGQVHCHNKSIEVINTDWIWRVDDDEIPEPTVLEKLVSCISSDVGAIGGLVLDPLICDTIKDQPSGKIENIKNESNIQWIEKQSERVLEVDHLYSSFLFRVKAATHGYCTMLSKVGHREETIFSHEIKLKGWRLLVNTSAKTWHYRENNGGIRSHSDQSLWAYDEYIFDTKMKYWPKMKDYFLVALDQGIGDHICFSMILPMLKEKYTKILAATCYPDIIEDKDINQISIHEGKILTNDRINDYSVYKYMYDKKWNKNIIQAFLEMYEIEEEFYYPPIRPKFDSKDIVISPYSKNINLNNNDKKINAKNYPYWEEVVSLLKTEGYNIIQIGVDGEKQIKGVNEFKINLSITDLKNLLINTKCFIAVDNMTGHLGASVGKEGIVIFGKSDPNIFGHPSNINLLKDRKYLRKNQFDFWLNEPYDPNVFVEPQVVVEKALSL
ncbi:MAG: glycosyltransferase [Bacillota bacterium]